MRVERFDYPEFSLVVSSADDKELWGSYVSPDKALLVALCGRIALDRREWDVARKMEGEGGLACKFISQCYSDSGIAGIESLSGNFAIILFDSSARTLFVVTDRWGLFPAFRFCNSGKAVYGSHPDAVADTAGEGRDWDLTSFAEFILTGRLSAPFTYYRNIEALPVASTSVFSFDDHRLIATRTHTYFQFQPQPQKPEKTEELAEDFAASFQEAVGKRTLPFLGKSAIALSGGLDSRTILCAAPKHENLITFSFFEEENREFRIARSIAREAGAEFVPLQRSFDYYGENAVLGARISAGMGCLASNHFLGFRSKLKELGVQNLLTGCYCDYLFKGLGLNKKVNRLTTREAVNSFDFSFYFGHFTSRTKLATDVQERLEAAFPPELRRYDTEAVVLDVERRRIFPLSYEEDNAERTIPQRTMPWYVPIADNGLGEVFQKMGCAMKLNRKLFARMVELVCGPKVCNIPDANTGAPINASPLRESVHSHLARLESLGRKIRPSNATTGSWLNWNHYATRSSLVQALWSSPNAEAEEIFTRVLGKEDFSWDISAYVGSRMPLFMQLFTLKVWLDQRPR